MTELTYPKYSAYCVLRIAWIRPERNTHYVLRNTLRHFEPIMAQFYHHIMELANIFLVGGLAGKLWRD